MSASMMAVNGSRPRRRRGLVFGLRHTVGRALRSFLHRLSAWRMAQRRGSRPAEVVIGVLQRPRLAITIRAAVVPTEVTPPPLLVFLERLVADPLDPYCPRCSLPLESWHGEAEVAGQPIGYECRPCGTRLRWTPADVRKQMQREVRRHDAHYWAQYREAIRQHERGAPRASVGGHHRGGGAR